MVLILGGLLDGVGNVSGNVANSGIVHPGKSPGILTIAGSFFTNLPGGTLAIDIGGRTAGAGYSQLAAGGSAEAMLGGTLVVSFVNGFLPSLGDSFTILSFPNVLSKGVFTSCNGLRPGNGLVLVPVYRPAGVDLVAANDPVIASPGRNGNQFSFTFPTTPGLSNVVRYTDSLSPPVWHTLTNVVGGGTPQIVVDPTATESPIRFYRVGFQ